MSDSAAETAAATGYEAGVAKLERELAFARRNGALAVRQMYQLMAKEQRVSERQLRRAGNREARLKKRIAEAEAAAAAATRRAERAERELFAVRRSTTWKAGRVVVSVPARLRRLVGG